MSDTKQHLELKAKAEEEKSMGNAAFVAGQYEKAIKHFTEAIKNDPSNAILYSNRSAAYASLHEYASALADALKTIELKPDWVKGYSRKGAALLFMNRIDEAAAAYSDGLEIDPNSELLRQSLQENVEHVDQEVWNELNERSQKPDRVPAKELPQIPTGVWVSMVCPLTLKNKIDWIQLDNLIEYFISKGVAGIFAISDSCEMFNLSNDEKLAIAQRVVKKVAGRVGVVACGNFGNSVGEQTRFIRQIYNTGVDAVVVVASLLTKQSDNEEVWKDNLKAILERTQTIPLGLYECTQPYPRILTPQTLKWVAETKRFVFCSEASSQQQISRAKVEACKEVVAFKVFNSNLPTLPRSLEIGGAGFCGVAANVYPDLLVWLCKHFRDKEAQVLHHFLNVSEPILLHKQPQSAKIYLRIFEKGFKGLEIVSRIG